MLDDVVVMVLAGGVGERLYPLTKERAKPAVYFGGPYRIIDFTLSNCLNSGLRRIFIALQYKSLSLNRHIRMGWGIVSEELGEFVEILPPQKRVSEHWYQGTADAVYQNLYSIMRENPRHLVVLSGDHVYKMDYAKMLRAHIEKNADATLATIEVTKAGLLTSIQDLGRHGHQAFGVPGLGFKRGLADDVVIAPYASARTTSRAVADARCATETSMENARAPTQSASQRTTPRAASSTHIAASFSSAKISSQDWDPNDGFFTSGAFIGDYNAIAASDQQVYAVWPDGRNNAIGETGIGETDIFTDANGH